MGLRIKPGELPDRFRSHLTPHGDHLLYNPTNSQGYGRFHVGLDLYVQAHRFAWELDHDPIPEGMTIDHVYERCQFKNCCNTEHMEVVTRGENARRYRKLFPTQKCPPGCTCKKHGPEAKARALHAVTTRWANGGSRTFGTKKER